MAKAQRHEVRERAMSPGTGLCKGVFMNTTIRAVYSGGMLRLAQPLALLEGETVEITIATKQTETASEDEIVSRLQTCQSFRDWFEVTQSLPSDEGSYDIVEALEGNRRWSGDRPLLSGERKE
jgi:predicted DNA-binding antitoxin AbrB/MazE fold protein